MQRQIESDPQAASKLLNTSALGGAQGASALSATTGENADAAGEEEKSDQKKKRNPLDKQTAFTEYKTQTDEGKSLEQAILQYREQLKNKKL